MKFETWLRGELDNRNWSQRQFAQKAGFSQAAVSLIFSGKRKPGVDICNAIAKVFGLPAEAVYRRAGILPSNNDINPDKDELLFLYNKMTGEEQEEFLASGRLKVELRLKRQGKISDNRGTSTT